MRPFTPRPEVTRKLATLRKSRLQRVGAAVGVSCRVHTETETTKSTKREKTQEVKDGKIPQSPSHQWKEVSSNALPGKALPRNGGIRCRRTMAKRWMNVCRRTRKCAEFRGRTTRASSASTWRTGAWSADGLTPTTPVLPPPFREI